jgi:hypothetical protein
MNPALSGFIDDSQEAISQLHPHYVSFHYTVLIIFHPNAANLIECDNKR